jgi:hypothetical protein
MANALRVATLALAGASSGIAVGKATNSAVRFVPHNGSTFLKIIFAESADLAMLYDPKFGVHGETERYARVTEFVQMEPCKKTPNEEEMLVRQEKAFGQIGQSVQGLFRVVRDPYQRLKTGKGLPMRLPTSTKFKRARGRLGRENV